MQKAKLAMEKEEYRNAINLLNQAILNNPKLKEAYLQRGFCYQAIAQKDSAINDYNTVLSLDPKNTNAWYYTGLCKYSSNKPEEAIENYNKALFIKGAENTADSVGQYLNTNSGVTEKQGIANVQPVQLYYQRGLAYYAAQQPQKAYRDFQTCITQKYNLDECIYLSSLCWMEGNKNKTPCDTFDINSPQGKNIAKNHTAHLCK